jgi:hypothetical protein
VRKNEARHPPGFFRLCAVFGIVWQLSPSTATIALRGPVDHSKKMVWIQRSELSMGPLAAEEEWLRPSCHPFRRQTASGTSKNEVVGVR